MIEETLEPSRMRKYNRFLIIAIANLIGMSFTGLYVGLLYYFFLLNFEEPDVLIGILFFMILGGGVIFCTSGLVIGLFINRREDVFTILLPNILSTLGGLLGMMLHITISGGWYFYWNMFWVVPVAGLWIILIIFLTTSVSIGARFTAGFRIKLLKMQIVFEEKGFSRRKKKKTEEQEEQNK